MSTLETIFTVLALLIFVTYNPAGDAMRDKGSTAKKIALDLVRAAMMLSTAFFLPKVTTNFKIVLCAVMFLGITGISTYCYMLFKEGLKKKSKNIELVADLLYFAFIFTATNQLTFTICYGLAYACYRIALHDLTYNLVRGLPWHYTGTTSTYEQIVEKNKLSAPSWAKVSYKLIASAFATLWLVVGLTHIQ